MNKTSKRPIEVRYRGKGIRKCKICGASRGIIRKYNLNVCRRCFREIGESIGFKKFG